MSSRNNGGIERAGFLLFVAVALLPIGASILYAVAYSLGLAGLLGEGFTLGHWSRLGEDFEIVRSFAMSIGVALAVVMFSVAVALGLSLALRRSLRSGGLGYTIYLPIALPGTVLAFLFFQILSGAGLLARITAALGIISDPSGFPGLVNDPYGIGIILAEMFVAVPFFTILFAQLHDAERLPELRGLAESLGAGRMDLLRRVVVPLLLRRAFPTIILTFIGVLGAYEVPLLLGPSTPQMISVLTMRKYARFDLAQKPEAFICAILYTALALALVALAYSRARKDDEA
ncbi:MAG: hypothetical protein JWQ98_2162 [Chlorobi bacterium]|nr:hypothetical protein [Chlorobiota bacterium]